MPSDEEDDNNNISEEATEGTTTEQTHAAAMENSHSDVDVPIASINGSSPNPREEESGRRKSKRSSGTPRSYSEVSLVLYKIMVLYQCLRTSAVNNCRQNVLLLKNYAVSMFFIYLY